MKFSDVLGHESAKEYLRSLTDSGNLPHALMISGPPGIGKMALALAFTQYLHCTDRRNGDSCGVCPSCRQHSSFNFPDLMFCYPVHGNRGSRQGVSEDFHSEWKDFIAANPLAPYPRWLEMMNAENSQPLIKVAESDEIIRKVSLSNFSADTKVMLMWLPEKLQPAAANKLLKIIEEPPAGNMFLLVSNNPAEVLPTIYSRTQRLELKPLSADLLASHIAAKYSLSDEQSLRIAAAASGSLLRAEEMVSEEGETTEFRELFRELMRRAYTKDVDALKEWSEKVAGLRREKSRRFTLYCARQIRGNYLTGIGLDNISDLDSPDMAFSLKFSPFIHGGNLEGIIDEFNSAYRDIGANGNPKIIFFDLALQMIVLIKSPKQNLI